MRGKLADKSLEGARIECDILDIIQSAVQVAWHIVMCTCVFRNLRAVVVIFVRVTLCCLGASLGLQKFGRSCSGTGRHGSARARYGRGCLGGGLALRPGTFMRFTGFSLWHGTGTDMDM